MRLKLSENLKQVRKDKGITQEQLANTLGVSFQSVSRWETGAAYPDIELLPVIAGYFGITVDELIGTAHAGNELRYKEYTARIKELREQGKEEERIKLLRQMHAEFPNEYEIVCDFCSSVFRCPEYLDEAREMVYDGLSRCTDTLTRERMIIWLSRIETEERLPDFLAEHSSIHDMREIRLLQLRYQALGEHDKYNLARQGYMAELFRMCFTVLTDAKGCDGEERELILRNAAKCIDTLSGCKGDKPISGDGVPDLWIGVRCELGVRLMRTLTKSGKTDEAAAAFKDMTELIEKCYALADGTELGYRSPMLGDITARTVRDTETARMKLVYDRPFCITDRGKSSSYKRLDVERVIDFAQNDELLRENSVVVDCLERLKKLIK
ncbi:MAG: helix-turn-helix transcriptional regulator [Clostridia bacterium]|nr:helix-turn-helix transcriptional regulator [Clostridia bacterium]